MNQILIVIFLMTWSCQEGATLRQRPATDIEDVPAYVAEKDQVVESGTATRVNLQRTNLDFTLEALASDALVSLKVLKTKPEHEALASINAAGEVIEVNLQDSDGRSRLNAGLLNQAFTITQQINNYDTSKRYVAAVIANLDDGSQKARVIDSSAISSVDGGFSLTETVDSLATSVKLISFTFWIGEEPKNSSYSGILIDNPSAFDDEEFASAGGNEDSGEEVQKDVVLYSLGVRTGGNPDEMLVYRNGSWTAYPFSNFDLGREAILLEWPDGGIGIADGYIDGKFGTFGDTEWTTETISTASNIYFSSYRATQDVGGQYWYLFENQGKLKLRQWKNDGNQDSEISTIFLNDSSRIDISHFSQQDDIWRLAYFNNNSVSYYKRSSGTSTWQSLSVVGHDICNLFSVVKVGTVFAKSSQANIDTLLLACYDPDKDFDSRERIIRADITTGPSGAMTSQTTVYSDTVVPTSQPLTGALASEGIYTVQWSDYIQPICALFLLKPNGEHENLYSWDEECPGANLRLDSSGILHIVYLANSGIVKNPSYFSFDTKSRTATPRAAITGASGVEILGRSLILQYEEKQ